MQTWWAYNTWSVIGQSIKTVNYHTNKWLCCCRCGSLWFPRLLQKSSGSEGWVVAMCRHSTFVCVWSRMLCRPLFPLHSPIISTETHNVLTMLWSQGLLSKNVQQCRLETHTLLANLIQICVNHIVLEISRSTRYFCNAEVLCYHR